MIYYNCEILNIIEKCKAGDNFAYESLLSIFSPILKEISYKYYIPRESVFDYLDEIYQEARIALYQAIQDYDQSMSVPFDKFLPIVLRRKLNDFIKYRTRKKHYALNSANSMDNFNSVLCQYLPDKDKLNDPAEAVTEKLHRHYILETISADLTTLEYKVFYLYFLEGIKQSEVAKMLNVKTKSVDNAIKRVKSKSLKYKDILLIA